MLGRLPM